MYLIDTHCHIDVYNDPAAVVAKTETNRIYTIAVTNLPSAFEQTESLLQGSKYLRPALGFHPQNAYRHHFEMARMWNILDRTRYIGEIGLDYKTSDSADKQVQRYIFNQILDRCSSAGNKILTVHSRRASEDVISAIGPKFPGKVILHWFSGSKRQLERAISCGYYFSINPAMMRSKRGANLITSIPRTHLLTESDGPYVKVNRRQAQPTDVLCTVRSLASLLGIDVEEMKKTIYENFRELLACEDEIKHGEDSESLRKNPNER